MSRLPMFPARLPASRVSRPEDPRSVAEALYDESLGDDAGSLLCELLDLHANRTGQNTARHARRILSGAARAGRQGIDESDALRRIAAFAPGRCREAVGAVARSIAGPAADKKTVHRIERRLRRKRREQMKRTK